MQKVLTKMIRRIAKYIRYKTNPAVRVAVIYVFFSFLWILFSDMLVELLFKDVSTLTKAQTVKGWFFVSVSGIIIYVLVSRSISDLSKTRKSLDIALNFHKTLFDEFPQPIYQMSPEGKVVYQNSKCKMHPGLNKTHLLDNMWLKNVHQDDRHTVLELYRNAITSEESYNIEYRLLQPDGAYKWVLDIGSPYYTPTGVIKGFISTFVDIDDKKGFEKEIKDTLEMYSSLFANNPNPMFVYDLNTLKILEVNNAAVSLYGFAKEEFINLTLKDITYTYKENDYLLHSDEIVNKESKHIKKNGDEIYVSTYVNKLPAFKGYNAGILVVQDITRSKNAFEELSESEERFKTVFKTTPEANLILSKQLIVLDVNNSASVFFSKTPNELRGISLHELFSIKHNKLFLDLFEEVDQRGFSQRILHSKDIGSKEFSAEIIALSFLEKGSKRYYLSLKDITEKIAISRALEESERKLSILINNFPGMVYRCSFSPTYSMEYASKGCYNLTGYKPEQLEGDKEVSFGALIHPKDRKRVWDEVDEQIYTGKPFNIIYRIITADNKEKWVQDQITGVLDSKSKTIFIEGFISDITEEKLAKDTLSAQMKELARVNSELERFTYTVAHDLRSPLVTISGFLETARESGLKGNIEQMDKDISRIQKAAKKMHYLLEDLLYLTRVGNVSGDFKPFSMNKLVSEILENNKERIKKADAKIIVGEHLPEVIGDRNRIEEVWQNLLENSLKFTRDKKPEIRIGSYQNENNQTVFFVEDNGIGVEKELKDKIFGLFNKLNPDTEGTGIGLAIVKRIVEVHEGKVWCESGGYNKGTKFLFTLGNK